MRRMVVGMAAALLMSFAGPALAEDLTEGIQEEERPGAAANLPAGLGFRVGTGSSRCPRGRWARFALPTLRCCRHWPRCRRSLRAIPALPAARQERARPAADILARRLA